MHKIKIRLLFLALLFVFAAGCIRIDQEEPKACTADAKLCPDGSGVGRDPNNNCEFSSCPALDNGKKVTVECTEEQRKSEVCLMIYKPVCGWFGENIQCVKYPCAQTYGNSCTACQNEDVSYWTEGECPTDIKPDQAV